MTPPEPFEHLRQFASGFQQSRGIFAFKYNGIVQHSFESVLLNYAEFYGKHAELNTFLHRGRYDAIEERYIDENTYSVEIYTQQHDSNLFYNFADISPSDNTGRYGCLYMFKHTPKGEIIRMESIRARGVKSICVPPIDSEDGFSGEVADVQAGREMGTTQELSLIERDTISLMRLNVCFTFDEILDILTLDEDYTLFRQHEVTP